MKETKGIVRIIIEGGIVGRVSTNVPGLSVQVIDKDVAEAIYTEESQGEKYIRVGEITDIEPDYYQHGMPNVAEVPQGLIDKATRICQALIPDNYDMVDVRTAVKELMK